MTVDYYQILGVSKKASDAELKSAFREKAKMYHPDSNPGNKETDTKFKEINEAYEVLSNSQKRQQYDMGIYGSTNQTTNTNSNASNIFNELYKEDIKKYNLEREDYIKFLDEMEPEFKKYNRTLKEEKANALKSNWSLIIIESFYDKKSKIKKIFNDLEKNVQAFDDFLIFFEKAEKSASEYGFDFNNAKQYIEPSKRGEISSSFYFNLKSQITSELYSLERNIKTFDDYIQFLDEIEKEFNQYNRTIKKVKEGLKGKRGTISSDEIYSEQRRLKKRLLDLETMARAFDQFSEYYENVSKEIQILYNRKLINFDEYIDPKNRTSFAPEVFVNKEREIENTISKLIPERVEQIEKLKEELEKRNINFGAYLATRNTDEFTISMSSIITILKSMGLIDKINANLIPFGITIEDYLKSRGKLLIDMKYKELLAISETLSNSITNNENILDSQKYQM